MINDPLDKVFLTPDQQLEKFIEKMPPTIKDQFRLHIDQRIAAAVAVEHRATLEQAAKVADDFECATYEEGWGEMERGARRCAAAIRALK